MMKEVSLRMKIDTNFDNFNEFEGFLIGQIRELMLERRGTWRSWILR